MGVNEKVAATFHGDDGVQERLEANCAWSDYRKDYGVSADKHTRMLEHKAFHTGWDAAQAAITGAES